MYNFSQSSRGGFIYYFIYLTSKNKTEHWLTDGMKCNSPVFRMIFLGIKHLTSVLVPTKFSNVVLFLTLFSFFAQNFLKKPISTSILSTQHPNAVSYGEFGDMYECRNKS